MNSNASTKPGPTYLGTLSADNSWRLENVFDGSYTCYELIISGMCPAGIDDRTFSAQLMEGGNILQGPSYQWFCESKDIGGGGTNGLVGQTSLALWDNYRWGPLAPGIFGQMTLFIGGGFVSHTTLVFAPVAFENAGCQTTIAGSYQFADNITPSGIAFGFELGTNSGQIEIWGIS